MATITTTETRAIQQTEEENVTRFLEAPCRDLDFLVYRFVPPTDKRGLPYPDLEGGGLPGEKVWVGDFAPQWGEFLLDLGEPVYDVQNYQPLVTRMEGYGLDQGRVKYRNLQTLSFPWGIDGSLPVQIFANQLFRDNNRLPFNPKGMSRQDLQWEARRRKLRTHGKRSDIIKRINDLELKMGAQTSTARQEEALQRLDAVTLPLHRVIEAQNPVPFTPQTPLKQPPFETGEIVLVYGTLFGDEHMCLVRDYEGNRGRISKDYLEEIEMAFGLKLNRRELSEILERLGWPDEEDPEPEPEPDSEAAKAAALAREEAARAVGFKSMLEREAEERIRKAAERAAIDDDSETGDDEAQKREEKKEDGAKGKLRKAEERKRKAAGELKKGGSKKPAI